MFGLFLIQVGIMMFSVVMLVKGEKDDALHKFMSNFVLLWLAVFVFLASIVVALHKKNGTTALPHSIGVPCWLLQTLALTYMISYMTIIGGHDPKSSIIFLLATTTLALIGIFLGGCLMKS